MSGACAAADPASRDSSEVVDRFGTIPDMTSCKLARITVPHPNDPKLRSFIDVDASFRLPDPEPALRRVLVEGRPRAARRRRDRRLCARSLGARAGLPARCRRPRRVRGADAQSASWRWGRKCGRAPGRGSANCCGMTIRNCATTANCARRALVPMADVKLHMPFAVAGYTDFYSSQRARHQCRRDVSRQGQRAAAELAAYADRLQRPRLDRGGQRHQRCAGRAAS